MEKLDPNLEPLLQFVQRESELVRERDRAEQCLQNAWLALVDLIEICHSQRLSLLHRKQVARAEGVSYLCEKFFDEERRKP